MATSTKTTLAASGYSATLRDQMKQTYTSLLSSHFSSTLATVNDIVNILVSQSYFESRFNTNALGPVIGASSSLAKDYSNSPAIVNFLKTATADQKANVRVGLQALGLGQSMGLNAVRGASLKTGKCLIETARSDLASQLCVNPGEDLKAKFLGDDNLNNALLAQLVVLESKFKAVVASGGGYTTPGDPYGRIFTSKIAAAVGAYLGLGAADQNGTSSEQYVAAIIGGSTYATANGTSLAVAQRVAQTSSTGTTNGSGVARITKVGC